MSTKAKRSPETESCKILRDTMRRYADAEILPDDVLIEAITGLDVIFRRVARAKEMRGAVEAKAARRAAFRAIDGGGATGPAARRRDPRAHDRHDLEAWAAEREGINRLDALVLENGRRGRLPLGAIDERSACSTSGDRG